MAPRSRLIASWGAEVGPRVGAVPPIKAGTRAGLDRRETSSVPIRRGVGYLRGAVLSDERTGMERAAGESVRDQAMAE